MASRRFAGYADESRQQCRPWIRASSTHCRAAGARDFVGTRVASKPLRLCCREKRSVFFSLFRSHVVLEYPLGHFRARFLTRLILESEVNASIDPAVRLILCHLREARVIA
jgi:hypothetical protein